MASQSSSSAISKALSLPMPPPTTTPAPLTDYTTLSFDVYGTLIEYKPHILTSFQPLLSRLPPSSPFLASSPSTQPSDPRTQTRSDSDPDPDPDPDPDHDPHHATAGSTAFLRLFQRHEDAIKLERPLPRFDAIMREMWTRIARELGVETSEAEARTFGDSIATWPAFGATVDALRRLGTRYRLVALSNIDAFAWRETKVLSGSNGRGGGGGGIEEEAGGIDWWKVLTADDFDIDAPDADTEKLRCLIQVVEGKGEHGGGVGAEGGQKERILHVAQSLGHDHVPAKKMGMASVWIVGDGGYWGKEGEWKMVLNKGIVGYSWKFATLKDFADHVDEVWERKEKERSQ